MTGDFRQTLPVIPRGTRADQIHSCVKASELWKKVQVFHLTQNIRTLLSGDPNAKDFEETLLEMGEGELDKDGIVTVPKEVYVKNKAEMIDAIFPDIETNFRTPNWLSKRAILAPKNKMVDSLNSELLKKIPGDEKTYKSKDFPIQAHDSVKYPQEVLNGLGKYLMVNA